MDRDINKLLSQDNLHTLVPGRRFYRVYWDSLSAKAYPKVASLTPWRFSPIVLPHLQEPVSALYFADTPIGCIRETVLRKGQTGVVPLSSVLKRKCIEVALLEPIEVYLLTSELLKSSLGFDPVLMNDYRVCRQLAALLARYFPNLSGIVYHSYQNDGHSMNLVTFAHQCDLKAFRFKQASADYLLSPLYRMDLLAAASSAGRELSSIVREVCLGKVPLKSLL